MVSTIGYIYCVTSDNIASIFSLLNKTCTEPCNNSFTTFLLRSAHTREHEAGTCCSDSFPRETWPVLRKSSVAETKSCPRNMLDEIQLVWIRGSWSRDKMTSFSMSHRVHCPSQRSPLQHRDEPISASCAPACLMSLQHASYAYTMGRVPRLHAPSAYPVVCADL